MIDVARVMSKSRVSKITRVVKYTCVTCNRIHACTTNLSHIEDRWALTPIKQSCFCFLVFNFCFLFFASLVITNV